VNDAGCTEFSTVQISVISKTASLLVSRLYAVVGGIIFCSYNTFKSGTKNFPFYEAIDSAKSLILTMSKRFCVIDTSRWPLRAVKWPLVSEKLRSGAHDMVEARSVRMSELSCHDPAYLDRFLQGTMTESEIRRIGIPYSPNMRERVLHVTGATVQAAEMIVAGNRQAVAVIGGGSVVWNLFIILNFQRISSRSFCCWCWLLCVKRPCGSELFAD
jgi:hypothetical protein